MRRHRTSLLLPVLALAGLAAACSSTPSTSSVGSSAPPTPSAPTPTRSAPMTAPTASPMSMPTGSSMPMNPPAQAGSAATLAVRIKDFAFTIPGPVKAGGTITVRNDDSEIHTFTLDGKNPLSVSGHSTATRTAPTQPGKHQVTCDFHGDMHGMLTVTA